jgi:DNA-binding beta-propeller fold protein YncE
LKFRAIAIALLAAVAFTQTGGSNAPRPNGWLVRPLGRTAQLGGFPIASALTPDGQFLLVLSSGEAPTLRVFATKNERPVSSLALPDAWLGLTLSPNGRLVYVGGGASGAVQELQLSPEGELRMARTMPSRDPRDNVKDAKLDDLIGDVAVSPDGRMVYAADVLRDQVLVINLSSGRVIERYAAGRRPYRIAFHPNGKTYFVTGWADGSLTQYDALTGRRVNAVGVGAHATDIAWRDKKTQLEEGEEADWAARLFIPAANTNNVYAAAITEAGDLRMVERIALGLFVDSPVGMTPSAVALSPDQSRLYVACSDANALAVVDVSGVKGRLLGFIPTGEYPTSVRTLNDGRIVVLNGAGTALFINPPADEALTIPTGIVLANSPLKDLDPRQRPIAMNPVPFTPGEPTPIDHVVYILTEGAPYPASGEQAAPNQFKLAHEFTGLPNFTATGTTPLEGFYWSTAAIVPDFVQKLQPAIRNSRPLVDELDIAAQPPAGYLWNALPARLFGIVPTARATRGVVVAAPLGNAEFKAPDRAISDVSRAQVFLKELAQFEQQQNLPKLMMLRLAGSRPGEATKGQRTAQAAIADNDYALGLILERLSHSKFWPKMAVFIAGTNAADHRASALIASPYATRGKAPAGAFNTLSIVRTIEHILGLSPLTQFDAGATPLDDVFQMTPDLRPYDVERPRVSTEALVP